MTLLPELHFPLARGRVRGNGLPALGRRLLIAVLLSVRIASGIVLLLELILLLCLFALLLGRGLLCSCLLRDPCLVALLLSPKCN